MRRGSTFQSTPPRGGRQPSIRHSHPPNHFNPRPREGGDDAKVSDLIASGISIHAPREGGDLSMFFTNPCTFYFNPRPPRGGRRHDDGVVVQGLHFNPRPPRGGRLWPVACLTRLVNFNPRPPRGGRRVSGRRHSPQATYFNPRPPRGGRLRLVLLIGLDHTPISIHAPREGGDVSGNLAALPHFHFNPRPPRGGRQIITIPPFQIYNFNPRPPRGGRQQRCTVLPADL